MVFPTVLLLLWDLYGDDEFQAIRPSGCCVARPVISQWQMEPDPHRLERLLPLHFPVGLKTCLEMFLYSCIIAEQNRSGGWIGHSATKRSGDSSELGLSSKPAPKQGSVDGAFVRLSSSMLAADGIIPDDDS